MKRRNGTLTALSRPAPLDAEPVPMVGMLSPTIANPLTPQAAALARALRGSSMDPCHAGG